jgi:2-polyprenyl-3-methyl-5-hydroxy-6-metoxy-1,4-benzoquinol methylase
LNNSQNWEGIMDPVQASPQYVLGHSESELQRLLNQSRFYGELTEDVFKRAGVAPGMHILDAGCGAGDVSFLAASIVGPAGSVLGVDRSGESIRLARQRTESAGLSNVKFMEADLTTLVLAENFDALVGRFVLLYLKNPSSILRRLSGFVRPGGLVVFQEMDMTAERAEPPVPTHGALVGTVAVVYYVIRSLPEVLGGTYVANYWLAVLVGHPPKILGGIVGGFLGRRMKKVS